MNQEGTSRPFGPQSVYATLLALTLGFGLGACQMNTGSSGGLEPVQSGEEEDTEGQDDRFNDQGLTPPPITRRGGGGTTSGRTPQPTGGNPDFSVEDPEDPADPADPGPGHSVQGGVVVPNGYFAGIKADGTCNSGYRWRKDADEKVYDDVNKFKEADAKRSDPTYLPQCYKPGMGNPCPSGFRLANPNQLIDKSVVCVVDNKKRYEDYDYIKPRPGETTGEQRPGLAYNPRLCKVKEVSFDLHYQCTVRDGIQSPSACEHTPYMIKNQCKSERGWCKLKYRTLLASKVGHGMSDRSAAKAAVPLLKGMRTEDQLYHDFRNYRWFDLTDSARINSLWGTNTPAGFHDSACEDLFPLAFEKNWP